jgi:AcrR family transcriptional regulator
VPQAQGQEKQTQEGQEEIASAVPGVNQFRRPGAASIEVSQAMSVESRKHPVEAKLETIHSASKDLARERVNEIQRSRILAAMTEVCVERGAANVTVAHVVARSGVSRRTFYEIFDNGENCFLTTVDGALARLTEHVLPAYESKGIWREQIRAALVALLSFMEVEPQAGHLLIVETLGAGPTVLRRRTGVLARVIAAVERGRAERGGAGSTGGDAPSLTAEGVVGGVLSVLHARLLDGTREPLLELTGPLMSMIVLPYLGPVEARRELERLVLANGERPVSAPANPLRDLEIRITYRIMRVLMSVAAQPSASNREIGFASGIQDQGQISKLLTRLSKLGLIENAGAGGARGAPNAWTLTAKGAEIEQAIGWRTD